MLIMLLVHQCVKLVGFWTAIGLFVIGCSPSQENVESETLHEESQPENIQAEEIIDDTINYDE
jgi:hypothetical protein